MQHPKKQKEKPSRSSRRRKSRDDSSSSSSSFRDALTSSTRSKHVELVDYHERNPGKLAQRVLQLMERKACKEGGAVHDQVRTPVAAMRYYLAIVLPLHGPTMGIRNQRELKTLCQVLDCLAAKKPAQAADLVAQRIKALEVGLTDGNWRRSQHLELIEGDGAPLVDKDEEYLMAKEEELTMRLQNHWYSGPYKGAGAKGGKETKGWGKGKKGPKGKGKKGKGRGAGEAAAPAPEV